MKWKLAKASQLACMLLMLTMAKSIFAIGIGTNLNSIIDFGSFTISSQTIYLPIKTSDNLIFEPFISRSNSESKSGGSTSTYTTQSFGLGIFTVSPIKPDYSQYLGVRIAKREVVDKNDFGTATDSSATIISPLIGLDYAVTNKITFAMEAGLSFADGNDKADDSDENDQATFTQFMVRYYF